MHQTPARYYCMWEGGALLTPCGPAPPTYHAMRMQVVKNQAAYYHQARVEIGVLQFLNTRADPGDRHHIVRLKVGGRGKGRGTGAPAIVCCIVGRPFLSCAGHVRLWWQRLLKCALLLPLPAARTSSCSATTCAWHLSCCPSTSTSSSGTTSSAGCLCRSSACLSTRQACCKGKVAAAGHQLHCAH